MSNGGLRTAVKKMRLELLEEADTLATKRELQSAPREHAGRLQRYLPSSATKSAGPNEPRTHFLASRGDAD